MLFCTGSTAALAERLQQHLLETEVTSVWRVCHLAVAPRRSNPALLAYRGELYLFGGGAFNDHFVNSNNVLLKYSPDTGRFEGVGVAEVRFCITILFLKRAIPPTPLVCRATRTLALTPGQAQLLWPGKAGFGCLAVKTGTRR